MFVVCRNSILCRDTVPLVRPELRIVDNRVASAQFTGFFVRTEELFVIARLNISAMVLIEVVELIVNVDRRLDEVSLAAALL